MMIGDDYAMLDIFWAGYAIQLFERNGRSVRTARVDDQLLVYSAKTHVRAVSRPKEKDRYRFKLGDYYPLPCGCGKMSGRIEVILEGTNTDVNGFSMTCFYCGETGALFLTEDWVQLADEASMLQAVEVNAT